MPFELVKKLDQEIWMKISGQFSVEDYEQTLALVLVGIEWYEDTRLLIILDQFKGWSKEDGWNDILFLHEQANKVQKMAIVGDEKWKTDVFMFVGRPFRTTEIEFFPEDSLEQAKQWLAVKD